MANVIIVDHSDETEVILMGIFALSRSIDHNCNDCFEFVFPSTHNPFILIKHVSFEIS